MAKDAFNSMMKIKIKEFTRDNGAKINFQGKDHTSNQMVPIMETG